MGAPEKPTGNSRWTSFRHMRYHRFGGYVRKTGFPVPLQLFGYLRARRARPSFSLQETPLWSIGTF